ncbi:MAG TPA: hypothetical protein VH092_30060 [Urbifossiella sp.]|jgi:hypothetical protein|nr:hypothetical protein [Urbifossiella sp.]
MSRSVCLLTVLLAVTGCARPPAPPIEPPAAKEWTAYELVRSDAPARLLPAKAFDEICSGMTLGELIEIVGVGSVMNGPMYSGTGIIQWACEDGRVLEVWAHSHKREEVIRTDGGTMGTGTMWMTASQRQVAVDIPVKKGTPPARPTLNMTRSEPPAAPGQGHLFVFEGVSKAPVHRAGPEHFRLTRITDGKDIPLDTAYEREGLDRIGKMGQRELGAVRARTVTSFNYQFHGVRLFLDTGARDDTDAMVKVGLLDLYGRAELEPDTRYRLTWACWQVGVTQATEMIYEFVTPK